MRDSTAEAAGRPFLLRAVATLAAVVVLASPATGQDDGSPWATEGEMGASLFFGASDQTAFLVRSAAEHTSERIVFGGELGFEYGEARVLEGNPFVNKRSWTSEASVDYTPEGRLSPFLSLTAEGALERRIDLRVRGGVGARYRFVRTDAQRLDLSLAALVERTDPRDTDAGPGEVETLGRWSARFRARRSMRDGGVVFDIVSFYRPAFVDPKTDYTVEVTSSLTFALSRRVGLKVSLAEKFDSLAEDRGARDNHDGRLFLSLTAASD